MVTNKNELKGIGEANVLICQIYHDKRSYASAKPLNIPRLISNSVCVFFQEINNHKQGQRKKEEDYHHHHSYKLHI